VREIVEAGGDATPIQLDVRNYEEIRSTVAQTIGQYKRLDVLICSSISATHCQRTAILTLLCESRQQWRDMVVERREDTNETLSAHAASQS